MSSVQHANDPANAAQCKAERLQRTNNNIIKGFSYFTLHHLEHLLVNHCVGE